MKPHVGPGPSLAPLVPAFWNVPVHSFISREKVMEKTQVPEAI